MSAIREMMNAMMGREDSAITATVQAVASDMTARTMGLMSSATANTANLVYVTDSLNGLTASVGGQLSAAASAQASARAEMTAAAATAQAEMTATLTTAANSMAARMADMSASNTEQISAAVTASVSRGNALQTTLTRAITAVNSTMIVSVLGKMDSDRHLWYGGCSGGSGCWADQCLDRVEIDTARPYFYKRTNTRMRAIVAGFFRMNMWVINHRNWAHLSVFINGRRITTSYFHTAAGWWKDTHQDHTHYIPANQDFWFQACGGTHGWSGAGYHHRQEYSWQGTRQAS